MLPYDPHDGSLTQSPSLTPSLIACVDPIRFSPNQALTIDSI